MEADRADQEEAAEVDLRRDGAAALEWVARYLDGVGELPVLPPPAAITNAIHDAVGARIAELPIRAESVWRAVHGNGKQ